LETFTNHTDALRLGYNVTHYDSCGVCSTTQDLAVYIDKPNLNRPTLICMGKSLLDFEMGLQCMKNIGFTHECAEIWWYNVMNTATNCFWVCIYHLFSPSNYPNGTLNACIQCDEDESGPMFKLIAGRTRRNSYKFLKNL